MSMFYTYCETEYKQNMLKFIYHTIGYLPVQMCFWDIHMIMLFSVIAFSFRSRHRAISPVYLVGKCNHLIKPFSEF